MKMGTVVEDKKTVRLHIPDLDADLHRKAKTAAAASGKTLKDWVVEAMLAKLNEPRP